MSENNVADNKKLSQPPSYKEAEIRAAIEGVNGCVVICIGRTGCGKNSVVQSLIAYMNSIGEVDLGDRWADKEMVKFFENTMSSFVRFETGVNPTGNPFFASFTFTPRSDGAKHMPVHMSFIDVRGEAYDSFVDDRGGIAKPENLEPYIKAAFSSDRAIVWLFVASPNNEIVNNARESNVLSSFLYQFEHHRTKEFLKKDRVILLISKADDLHANPSFLGDIERLYAEAIDLFENRHKAIFGKIAYSTGNWNSARVPTSLNKEKARELTNYLYRLVANYDLPREGRDWYGKVWDWFKRNYWLLRIAISVKWPFK